MKNFFKLSMLSSGLMALGIMASSSAIAQGACSVAYDTVNSWGNGGQYKVTLTNTGAAKTSWELCWTFAGNDTIPNLWDGIVTQTGKNVCVKNAAYNTNLPANGSVNFGFLVNNPGVIPTAFTLNGAACGGSASSASSIASSTPSSVSSSSSSSVAPVAAARWLVDASKSTFNFVTVKKTSAGAEVPETMTFSQLQGTVAANGQATLTIPLASISTGNVIREPRMQSLLFESSFLPNLHFTTQLDLAAIDAMAAGSTSVQSVTGNLVLHGIVKAQTFDVLVVKHANNSVSFSPRRPIIINSVDFDLNAGVEALRAIAGLTTIGEKVPVYFKMFLNRDNPTNVPAISLAPAPAAALNLTGSVSNATGAANLNWVDVSSTETGFLIRRKGADGRWQTASNNAANSVSFIDDLAAATLGAGSYDYKVISYTDSIPATATNALTLVYAGTGTSASSTSSVASSVSTSSTSSRHSSASSGSSSSAGTLVGNATQGQALWTSRGCVGCHGVDGEKNANGTVVYAPLNANRSAYRHRLDTQDRSLRDFIAMWMPEGSGGTCTGQCAADLEAYIFTWRQPSDGIPNKPSTSFSCPSTAPNYGQRTLRLLTKAEYQRTVRDLVNYTDDVISRLPDDLISGAFVNNNNLQIDKTRYSSYLGTAERIAENVATRWSSVLSCTPSASCANTLVDTLAPRIFRRPLTTDERTAYLAVANGTSGGRSVQEGMQIALAAMLSSPQFLYRSEIGELSGSGVYKLTGYEMATYLAYTFTGSTPNQTLLTAAGNGSLNTAAGIRTQAANLLGSANTKVLLSDFVNRWLGTENLTNLTRTGATDFVSLATDMKAELGKNFANALLDTNSNFGSLYNPNYTYVNQRLANHYGLGYSASGADADGFVRVATSDRGGILASGAFMSRYSSNTDSNLITRSVAVRRKIMCQDIPEPPSGVSLDREAIAMRDAEFFNSPTTTQLMIANRITAGTTCSNCHAEIINPLGGGMENFDHLGRVRSTDPKGNPVYTTSTFFSPYQQLQFLNDPDRVIHHPAITFSGAKDLGRTIVEDPVVGAQAQTCLATQFVSYSSGIHSIFLIDDNDREVGIKRISQAEEDAYRCEISDLTHVLNTRGPRAMLEEIPALESVMYRQVWAR